MTKTAQLLLLLLLLLAVAAHAGVVAAEPHPHQGITAPYPPGKPDVKLSSSQLRELAEGKLVQDMLKVPGGGGGRALAVQDVHAPPEYVWDRILDFPNYKNMVPKVSDCYNYYTETMRNGTEIIKTRLKLNVFGAKFDSYIYHTHYPQKSSLTWTLDYSKKSSMDDSVGFWYVAPPPDRPDPQEWSRVYYSCKLHVPSWVPGIVIGYLTKKAIKEANAWVKRESELKYQRDLSSGRMLRSRRATTPLPTMPSLGGFGGRRARQEAILAAEEAARKEVERLEAATALAKERAQRIRGMISSGVKSAVSVGAGYGMCWWLQVRAKGPRGAAAA